MLELFFGILLGAAPFLVYRIVRVPQNAAEAAVNHKVRRHFSTPDYHLLENLTIPYRNSTTQIDHVLVSRYGVFVIETKGHKGWIFGDEKSQKWTQVLYQSKFRFQNPLRQNSMHVKALSQLLEMETGAIHSLVVFCGDCTFKTDLPSNVIRYSKLVNYIESFTEEYLTHPELVYAVGLIETKRLARSGATDEQHRNNVAAILQRKTRGFKHF